MNDSHPSARVVRFLNAAMEALVLGMAAGAPWAFGSTEPLFEFLLCAALAGLLILWALKVAVQGTLRWSFCPVALCLVGLVVLDGLQLTPIPRQWLAYVAPGTEDIYARLLPAEPEILSTAIPTPEGNAFQTATVSLYPHATRQELVRVLSVLLLFLVVYNNLGTTASLKRLSAVMLINGGCLAAWGVYQKLTSSPNVIYWNVETIGNVFGPFVCRNHFAAYANMCIALGAGLLLATSSRRTDRSADYRRSPWSQSAEGFLDDWRLPAICFVLVVMICGVFFSLSRGGMVALLGGAATCLAMGLCRSQWTRWSASLASLLVVAGALLVYVGADQTVERVATLWNTQESRLALWSRCLPMAATYPVFGTGDGTFSYVEPIYRSQPLPVYFAHAENAYLEALFEGGAVRLALTLALLGCLLLDASRAVALSRRSAARHLAIGAVFALTTLVLHSFVDFGIEVPAVTVLATVTAAQVCRLGRRPFDTGDEAHATPRRSLPVALAGVAALLVLGGVVLDSAWRRVHVDRDWVVANGAPTTAAQKLDASIADVERLTAAQSLAPNDAALHTALGESYLTISTLLDSPQLDSPDVGQQRRRRDEYRLAALGHFVRARNLCPLRPVPHVRLAANAEHFARAEPRQVHLERAKYLVPSDAEFWYLAGVQELADGRLEQTWDSWRRSIVNSEQYVKSILDAAAVHLTPQEMCEKLLPAQPRTLLVAARHQYPRSGDGRDRAPLPAKVRQRLLRHAIDLFERDAAARRSPDHQATAAEVHRELGDFSRSVALYRQALLARPSQTEWRVGMAEAMTESGQYQLARNELLIVLENRPNHPQANRLLKVVVRRLVEDDVERTGSSGERTTQLRKRSSPRVETGIAQSQRD